MSQLLSQHQDSHETVIADLWPLAVAILMAIGLLLLAILGEAR